MLGNTNTPEFLMAYETNNRLNGKTSNPWNLAYSAGGSSGGEAAAIASGCSMGGVGSDGGGSIRVSRALLRDLRIETDTGHAFPRQDIFRRPAAHFPGSASSGRWHGSATICRFSSSDGRAG